MSKVKKILYDRRKNSLECGAVTQSDAGTVIPKLIEMLEHITNEPDLYCFFRCINIDRYKLSSEDISAINLSLPSDYQVVLSSNGRPINTV